MTQYRRFQHPGATWFFTVNLAERRGNSLLLDRIDAIVIKEETSMRSISENDLSVIIPLLAAKIREIKQELLNGEGKEDDMTDEEFDQQTDNRDLLAAYERTMDNLQEEYEAGRSEGIILPSFEELTKLFDLKKHRP